MRDIVTSGDSGFVQYTDRAHTHMPEKVQIYWNR
jgi:hypothetical protein